MCSPAKVKDSLGRAYNRTTQLSLRKDMMQDRRFNGKGSDEQSLLRQVLDTFKHGDIVVGDAFLGTYFLPASLRDKEVNAVFEQMRGASV